MTKRVYNESCTCAKPVAPFHVTISQLKGKLFYIESSDLVLLHNTNRLKWHYITSTRDFNT